MRNRVVALSDDDLDEITSDLDDVEEVVKEEKGAIPTILKGKLPPPRALTYSTKQIHGELLRFDSRFISSISDS